MTDSEKIANTMIKKVYLLSEINLTNYKCNEQRTLDNNKLDFWKEGRKYYIRKKWCIELNKKELETLLLMTYKKLDDDYYLTKRPIIR